MYTALHGIVQHPVVGTLDNPGYPEVHMQALCFVSWGILLPAVGGESGPMEVCIYTNKT